MRNGRLQTYRTPNIEAISLSIQFTTPKGNPVVIRRPELIVSMVGYERSDRETGEMRQNTAITFENREVVFVSGSADVIEAALEEHARVARLNSEYCDRCPALANASEELKQYEAVVDAAEPPADTDNRL